MPVPIRFGSFELDLETAEVCTDGRTMRLPEQQFQILHMLLLADGSVVSREEIRKRLWPNDTVVEYDRSINTAIMTGGRGVIGAMGWPGTKIDGSGSTARALVSRGMSRPRPTTCASTISRKMA